MKGFFNEIIIGLFFIGFVFTGCQSKFIHQVEKNRHSVTIHQDSVIVEIEIVDNAIVHVKKTLKGDTIKALPNYVTVLEPEDVDWNIIESKEQLTISTNDVTVLVNSDGTIEYKSIDGKHLLSETNDLTYLKSGVANAQHVSQGFIAGDEALYGLGQYQSGIMNWKNVPNRLEQFNQEIAIPFLVSTNNYGIYWHNYSVTDFNQAQNKIVFSSNDDKVKI